MSLLDIDPQSVAADPAISAFVTANAGSGKTKTLIDRVARLLLDGAKPETILCVTYTKPAAAEMQRRLYRRLGDWSVMADEGLTRELAELEGLRPDAYDARRLSEARALFAQALETPGGLKIQTIHAFCEKLLRRFPLEAGVSPGFRVMDDAAAAAVAAAARAAVADFAMRTSGELAQAYARMSVELDYASFQQMFLDFEARRGKLKIFFGASAGVGKTYAMLSAARAQAAQGVDLVIGVVETHGRGETEALLSGLERMPLREVQYRGRALREFDLDGVLARRPALVLVDELAHSNVPGSRHPKRWQDVHELLAAGIDVWTTVNVQHLETLNDVVSGITGVRVRETVPDRVFDEADEVVIVDLPPDDLLQRLKDGKVYMPQQAATAVRNFFRKGNLIALRELALRRTADRVDDDMLHWRRTRAVSPVWQTREAGTSAPTVRTISLNRCRSSPRWIASMSAPISSTP